MSDEDHTYHGCIGIDCPWFDYRSVAPGCIFYPALNKGQPNPGSRALQDTQPEGDEHD
ncbi:MAG: hypothetical protein ACXWP0_01105 [Ktedonobacterales bacterium]